MFDPCQCMLNLDPWIFSSLPCFSLRLRLLCEAAAGLLSPLCGSHGYCFPTHMPNDHRKCFHSWEIERSQLPQFCNWGLLQSFEVTNFDERHDWLTDPPSPFTANYKWQIWERECFGSHCSVFNIRITHIHRSHDTWSIIFAPYLRTHAVGG